jgi:hypothetical protein
MKMGHYYNEKQYRDLVWQLYIFEQELCDLGQAYRKISPWKARLYMHE